MKRILPVVIAALFASPTMADDTLETAPNTVFLQAVEADLGQFVWKKRPVVVFSDSDADPPIRRPNRTANGPDWAEIRRS